LGIIVTNSLNLNFSLGLATDCQFSNSQGQNQGMSLPKTKIHKEEQPLHIITSLFETQTDDCG
jgi:hypothetical protein